MFWSVEIQTTAENKKVVIIVSIEGYLFNILFFRQMCERFGQANGSSPTGQTLIESGFRLTLTTLPNILGNECEITI